MLEKEIELPLFHLGSFRDRNGHDVVFDDALLRQLEKNTNFVLRSKILQAPIGYDHPAAASDAHGLLTGARYENGVLYVRGRNWSDQLVSDVKSSKRLAYSGEFDSSFEYVEPGTSRAVKVGPTVIGLAILGARRPAIKGLKPLADVQFSEKLAPADIFMVREQLKKSGVVSEFCDGVSFFAEVENDTQRFFEEKKEMDEKDVQRMIDSATASLKTDNTALRTQLDTQKREFDEKLATQTTSEKRKTEVAEFCETVQAEKKSIGKLSRAKLEDILNSPAVVASKELDGKIRAFVESLPSAIVPGGIAGAGKKKKAAAAEFEEGDDDEESSPLQSVTVKDFSEFSRKPEAEKLVSQAVREFGEKNPEKVKGKSYAEKLAIVQRFVTKREAAAE